MRNLLAILLLAALVLPAQQGIRETLDQCKAELQAEMPVETRRSAVMVLGKYDTPEVTKILGGCLSDKDVEVRRSALAALAEKPERLRAQAPAILNCMKDEDVHIRRYASSLISDCIGISIRGSVQLSPGSRITTGASKSITNAAELLAHGLQDEDAEVRRNVLQGAQYFDVALPQKVVLPLLKDPSDQVVAQAISLAVRSEGDANTLLEACKPLLRHPNPQIRLTLANALAYCPDATELLLALSRDENQKVRYQALLSRARASSSGDDGLVSEILNALSAGALASSEGERMLSLLADFQPESAWQFVRGVLEDDSNAALQETAWMQVVRHREWQERLELYQIVGAFCKFSDNSRIRMMLLSLLRKRAKELTAGELSRLQSSPLVSCRKVVFDLLRNLPSELQSEALTEALLDEDNSLRLQAVNQFSSLRPQGWEEILIATLEDPDAALQHAAAKGLMRDAKHNPEIKAALSAWLPKCADESLRTQIQNRLR